MAKVTNNICFCCNRAITYSDSGPMRGGHYQGVCWRCVDNRYVKYCARCNKWYVQADIHTTKGTASLCNDCHSKGYTLLKVRGENPTFTFYHMPRERSRLFLGIELETGVKRGSRKDVNWYLDQIPDFMWPKHDGSICNDTVGEDIEICSHPATFKWLKANRKEWDGIFKLRKHGLLSWEAGSCGMHIHMSKAPFTKKHACRFADFIYHNEAFSRFISGRRDTYWCSLDVDDEDFANNWEDPCHEYWAVAPRRHTLEIRLFRGTLNPVTFWKNVEFIHALYHWTKSASRKNYESVPAFLEYVSKRSDCTNFHKWLKLNRTKVEELTHAKMCSLST